MDHKLFTAGSPLVPDLLTIAEQMPGMMSVRDVTPALESTGFWSSFNIPALPITYNVSGYNTGCISPYGTWAWSVCLVPLAAAFADRCFALRAALCRRLVRSSFSLCCPLPSLSLSASGYIGNFRQVLFEQLQGSVVDLASMQSVMMYNEWQVRHDAR